MPSSTLVDGGRSSPPAGRRWSTDPDETDLDGRISHVLSGPGAPAPTLRPPRPSTRTGRAAGDTSSRRLSGCLMLVTTAVDPPRRPTSDPRSQLTIGTGCSLRRAPDDGTSDGTLSWYELTCAGGRSLGRSRRRAPMRSASRVVRPATTLPGVYSGPAPGSLTARTGEPSAVGP